MSDNRITVTILSSSYPTVSNPYRDVFIRDESIIVNRIGKINVILTGVISLPFTKRYNRYQNLIRDEFDIQIIKYLSIPGIRFPGISQFFYQRSIKRLLGSIKSDIVHAHFAYPSAFALPVISGYGMKSVLTIHGVDFQLCMGKRKLEKMLYRNLQFADAIIAVGPKLRQEIVDFCPELDKKTIVMLHGIDADFFIAPVNKKEMKINLGWDINKVHVLCVARIVHKKGHDLLIKAIQNLKADTGNAEFHLIGEKSDMDWFHELEIMLKEYDIGNVIFHPPANRDDLLKFYQASDVYVQPSRDEPFGLAVAEAGSCGLPVLSTFSGGPDVIVTDETGIIVTADEAGITEGLGQMLKSFNNFDRDRISESVRDRFSTIQKQQNLVKLYQEVLNSDFDI